MNKTIILPILSALALTLQTFFGIHISDEIINEAALWIGNGILLGTTLYGIIKNHQKDKN